MDEERLLEKLRQREAQLKSMLDACTKQIRFHEESMQRKKDIADGKFSVQRLDEENRIIVYQKELTRTFAVPAEAMDTCADILRELFCVPGYVNLSLSDIPEKDDDRTVLVQTLEGGIEELTALTPEQIFSPEDNAGSITAALFSVELNAKSSLDDVERISAVAEQCFSPESTTVWGAAFSAERQKGTARIGIIGMY